MSEIEIIATIFGVICVWLTIKQHIACWPIGLVQVVLYISVFYQAKLYADMVLHVIYVLLSIYGWYHWSESNINKESSGITLCGKFTYIYGALCLALTLILGFTFTLYTDASLTYPDSFIMSSSLIAQWLMSRKKLESWILWIHTDIVAIYVYWYKELYWTTGLYLLFLFMAISGLAEWRKDYYQAKSILVK
ncbi:nicotinamide mononucleotide transporter [Sporocytophaga myxococcoides]|uniref:Nicotinamide riboside transporter PnuC n=1 Tax=Sporocytophaga myxococcoides TaxID=153721 RepID=A0A098LH20_9BACT|nr:nicotinamide riboside transporter PnuC [Sporocytophaga myxococcoides]GAL85724.1 nicotinamide mononucleotide transporter [Sporocytophaga myxococcoides]